MLKTKKYPYFQKHLERKSAKKTLYQSKMPRCHAENRDKHPYFQKHLERKSAKKTLYQSKMPRCHAENRDKHPYFQKHLVQKSSIQKSQWNAAAASQHSSHSRPCSTISPSDTRRTMARWSDRNLQNKTSYFQLRIGIHCGIISLLEWFLHFHTLSS